MNWKYILIVFILATVVGGGILTYQYWSAPKEEIYNCPVGADFECTGSTHCPDKAYFNWLKENCPGFNRVVLDYKCYYYKDGSIYIGTDRQQIDVDGCYYKMANFTQDYTYCHKIDRQGGFYQLFCYRDLVEKTNDDSICSQTNDSLKQFYCFKSFVKAKNDVGYCNKIQDSELIIKCKTRYHCDPRICLESEDKKGCLNDLIESMPFSGSWVGCTSEELDSSICEYYDSVEDKDECYYVFGSATLVHHEESGHACKFILNSALKNDCYFNSGKWDKEFCDFITDGKKKQECKEWKPRIP